MVENSNVRSQRVHRQSALIPAHVVHRHQLLRNAEIEAFVGTSGARLQMIGLLKTKKKTETTNLTTN